MSLWTNLRDKIVVPAVRGVAAVYTGGASEVLYKAVQAGQAAQPALQQVSDVYGLGQLGGTTMQRMQAMPGRGLMQTAGLPALPRMPNALSAGGAVAGAARAVGYGAGRAAAWCRRNPVTCGTLGLEGVQAAMARGEIKAPRRRSRGITGTELRNFRRVVRFTQKYCAPIHKAHKAPVFRKRR